MAAAAVRNRQTPSPRPTRSPRDAMSYKPLRAASPVSPVLAPSSPSLSGYSSSESEGPRRRQRRPNRSPQAATSSLPIIRAHVELDPNSPEHADTPAAPSSAFKDAPNGVNGAAKPVLRRRRSSSVHAKPPPGVTPTKAVDWEIPRKTLHSSIGFLTLALWYHDPPTLRPLITYLSLAAVSIGAIDVVRLNVPKFAEAWEAVVGFLMREEERTKPNGVIWYLIGVVFVLSFYPKDVAVVSILILSWSDTTASTIGRLWGKYTKPLPAHLPGVPALKFAARKSLAGFLAATVTGLGIGLGFWHKGCKGEATWEILRSTVGRIATAGVVGLGGAVVEALDLGCDDNLSLPILSGAVVWAWLASSSALIRALF